MAAADPQFGPLPGPPDPPTPPAGPGRIERIVWWALDALALAADLVEVARRYAHRDHWADRRLRAVGYRRTLTGAWVPLRPPPLAPDTMPMLAARPPATVPLPEAA